MKEKNSELVQFRDSLTSFFSLFAWYVCIFPFCFFFFFAFPLPVILVNSIVEGVWQYKEGNESTVSYKALVGGFHLNFVCSCVNFDTKYIIWKKKPLSATS